MRLLSRKNLLWGGGIFSAFCWAYSLATRFTDFLFAPRQEKVLIFLSLLFITSLAAIWFFWVLLFPFFQSASKKILLTIIAIAGLAIGVLFSAFYRPPPFPELHTLKITVLEERNPQSSGSDIEILSLTTETLPGRVRNRIAANELTLDSGQQAARHWQMSSDGYGLTATNGQGFSAGINRFMQAGIYVRFKTGPSKGMVQIEWDDNIFPLDLYTPEPGETTQYLEPGFNWKKADPTRKMLVAGALAADFFGALFPLAIISLVFHQSVYSRRIKIRQPGLLLAALVLVVALLAAATAINRPVNFENKQLEAIVRNAIHKSDGHIYQHQLLTIIRLEAAGQKLTSLDGIEQLKNLRQLDLRDNQIEDISLLRNLIRLEELNLRNNKITDLSALENLTRLEYLNIHSNSSVQSIQPLKNLVNLQKLVMAKVPAGNESDILENLKDLRYLNLRECGMSTLEPIAALTELEYLNLHSNTTISTIRPLQSLNKLHTLILGNLTIGSEISILENYPELRYLNLRNAGLGDISALAELKKLEYLNLHSNPEIQTIRPLENLGNLEALILRNVTIGDEAGILRNFSNLENLNVRNCGMTSVADLGDLMSKGALQDNPKKGIEAEVDIRDNPIPRASFDSYSAIRPYWENISIRQPVALPFYAELPDPVFSRPAGFYAKSFLLELSTTAPDADIYYTLDGTEPGNNSKKYTEPIAIASRAGEPNVYSAIEAIAAGWKKPASEVFKATIVRAKVIDRRSSSTSAAVTHTYFIGEDIQKRYSLPIISLVSDPQNLFDPDLGIYGLGRAYQEQKNADLSEDERQTFANFNQHGEAWERPVSIELFEPGGNFGFSQNGGVRIHGGGSRRNPQKTLRIYAGVDYDRKDTIDYPLFFNMGNTEEAGDNPSFRIFLLRNSGQDWNRSMLRDAFVQKLVGNSYLDTQASRMAVVFLNGEYWGVYNLQEKYDEYYLENHYEFEREKAVILRQDGILHRGNPEDETHYSSLLKFISGNSLSDQQNYDYIRTQIDVDNYIDYQIMEIFAGNDDWPDNNLYYWRMRTDRYLPDAPYGQDGRWRWMLFDMDFGFGLKDGINDYQRNTLKVAQQPGWGGFLFRSLLENEQFKIDFINRFADHLNTTLNPERVLSILEQTRVELANEIEESLVRWGVVEEPMKEWEQEIYIIREFAKKRPEAIRKFIMDQFDIAGTAKVAIRTDLNKGYVKVNSIEITSDTQGIKNPAEWEGIYFKGIPVRVTAVANPGYRFAGWEESGKTSAELILNLQDNVTLSAIFTEE